MPIASAYAYLIHPGKGNASPTAVSGQNLTLGNGSLSDMLNDVFASEASARDFEITFNLDANGQQHNTTREMLVKFQSHSSNDNGELVARRLQGVTDGRSGIGLLFLLSGSQGLKQRLVVSRFPTDQAILAEIGSTGLDVAFLEQVFIKRLSAYKALMLEHKSPASGFWSGMATDRQAGSSGEHISEYWLKDFLNADFSETPAQGTRRLATALKKAIKANPDVKVKGEIAAASSLAATIFAGKSVSVKDFCKHFGFSNATIETIKTQLPKLSLYSKMFHFDPAEFKSVNPYRTVELSTGAILTAPNDEFADVFTVVPANNGEFEYKTQGRVSDQRLAKR